MKAHLHSISKRTLKRKAHLRCSLNRMTYPKVSFDHQIESLSGFTYVLVQGSHDDSDDKVIEINSSTDSDDGGELLKLYQDCC